MQKIRNSTRSIDYGETSWNDKGLGENFGDHRERLEAISKANTTSIRAVLNFYKIENDESMKSITCPFLSHSKGQERSPSFYIYNETNSFWCFGCKVGSKPCDFVSELEGITKSEAALKILSILPNEYNEAFVVDVGYQEKFEILSDFSIKVRQKIHTNMYDKSILTKIEKICKVFDDLNCKHDLNVDATKSTINILEKELKKI